MYTNNAFWMTIFTEMFSCSKCTATFTQSSSLTRHLNEVHSRNYRFRCPDCSADFSRRADCIRHIARRHDDAEGLMDRIIRTEVTPQTSGTSRSRSPSRMTDTRTAVAAKDTLDATIDDQDPLAKETGSCTVTVARVRDGARQWGGSGDHADGNLD